MIYKTLCTQKTKDWATRKIGVNSCVPEGKQFLHQLVAHVTFSERVFYFYQLLTYFNSFMIIDNSVKDWQNTCFYNTHSESIKLILSPHDHANPANSANGDERDERNALLAKYHNSKLRIYWLIDWLIDWLMFNANISDISAISWRYFEFRTTSVV